MQSILTRPEVKAVPWLLLFDHQLLTGCRKWPQLKRNSKLKRFLSPLPFLHVLTKSLSGVCPRPGCGTAEATTGKTKGAVSHYVPPGFLPLEGKCFAPGPLQRGPTACPIFPESCRSLVIPTDPSHKGFLFLFSEEWWMVWRSREPILQLAPGMQKVTLKF